MKKTFFLLLFCLLHWFNYGQTKIQMPLDILVVENGVTIGRLQAGESYCKTVRYNQLLSSVKSSLALPDSVTIFNGDEGAGIRGLQYSFLHITEGSGIPYRTILRSLRDAGYRLATPRELVPVIY